jgi:hypothetical protein
LGFRASLIAGLLAPNKTEARHGMMIDPKQEGPLCGLKGEHPHVYPSTQEAPLRRLSVAIRRRALKGSLPFLCVRQELTSYNGLGLLRRYLHRSACRHGRARRVVG